MAKKIRGTATKNGGFMKDSEMRAFSLMVSKMSDLELKQDLRSINRIEEKDLDLAVKLLRKILTVEKLVEDDLHHNCVGAVDPAFLLLQPQAIAELTYLWANNIKGTDLYTLWNDCSGRKPNMFILNIWALQSGVYLKSEIDENFRINHLDVDIDGRINNQDDEIWFERANRAAVLPFIFGENFRILQKLILIRGKYCESWRLYERPFKSRTACR